MNAPAGDFCVEEVPVRTPPHCFGRLVSGTTAPPPPLRLRLPRFEELFVVGAVSWNEVVHFPGYLHFCCRLDDSAASARPACLAVPPRPSPSIAVPYTHVRGASELS